MKKSKSQKPAGEKEAELSEKPDLPEEFLIVGIGASAGGVQALKDFFQNVPADSGIAYVVILHLSPDHDSQLASVLQTVASIPVAQVTEQIRVEPNRVYVVPPNEHLEMFDGQITVTPNLSVEERRAPVDIFFRTLAESHHARAVAVVLSGTGANGSMGIKRVKERGGAAFVQNPREAEFSEMPRNSIATDLIDQILNAADIPARIIAYKNSIGAVEIPVEAERRPEDTQQALREIFTQLRLRTGHDFSNYKRPTILRRIERRINVFNLPNLEAYARLVRGDKDEPVALLKDLLISVTNFFRDKEAFLFLETDVLPRIFYAKTAEDQVRIWICGCATGEEAYSVAMLCGERTLGMMDAPTVQIFATDIDEGAIATAREGFYTLNDAADVSPERLRRFFTKEGEGYRVRRELREMILFANHNVLKEPPFSHLDMVTCRNMLIYLNPTAQERVMETFHFALNPGGFLFLGNSESVDGVGDLYATVNKEKHLFQSRQAAGRVAYPVPETSFARLRNIEFEHAKAALTSPAAPPPRQQTEAIQSAGGNGQTVALQRQSYGELHQQLLELYAPPSVVVNEEYDIVHLSERAGRFLQIAGGEPTKNLLKLIRPELRLELRAALYQAVQNQTNVEVRNLKFGADGGAGQESVNIYARPVLQRSDNTARGFILVLFEPIEGDAGDAGRSEQLTTTSEPIARRLEEELLQTKSQLRNTIEQLELQTEELRASNEELQALNEELRSAAEELETSKEELQSVNEELITVNQELKVKIEEVSQTSNDFQNLIYSTDVVTLFLDRSFRVHTFTPAASRIFNLIPADAGRPITDITHRLEHDGLLDDAETVLRNLQTVEREARTTDGRTYLLRVLPYRTAEDRINGVVVTFLDITERKRAENRVRESEERLRQSINIETVGVIFFNNSIEITDCNDAFLRMSGFTRDEIRAGRYSWELFTPEEFIEPSKRAIEELNRQGYTTPYEKEYVRKDGSRFWGLFSCRRISPRELVEFVSDITERKLAQEALRESEQELSAFVGATSDTVYEMSADWREMLSLNGKEFIVSTDEPRDDWTEEYIPDDEKPRVWAAINRAIETNSIFELEHRVVRLDGGVGWTFSRAIPLLDAAGEIRKWFGAASDITERKRAAEALAASEVKYRTLFDSLDEGVSTVEVIFDENDRAVDLLYLEHNQALTRLTGLTQEITGKRTSEVLPDLEPFWFETFGRVARTGEPERVEHRIDALDSWFDVYAARVGDRESRRVVVVYNNITERKRRERQQEFLLKFSDKLRTLPNAEAIENASLQLLAEFLNLDRAYIATVYRLEDRAAIGPEYRRPDLGLAPVAGELRMSDFPEGFRQVEDQTLVVDNIADDSTLSERDRHSLGAINLTALVVASVRKGERDVMWSLVASTVTARNWTTDEVRLIETVAERTWAAATRARAEEAVREIEKLRDIAVEGGGMGTWRWDTKNDRISGDAVFMKLYDFPPSDGHFPLAMFTERMSAEAAAACEAVAARALVPGEEFDGNLELANGRWVRWRGRGDHDDPHVIYGVSFDVTEPKQAEERQQFMLKLSDALRPLSDAAEIQRAAVRVVGEELEIDRVLYAEIGDDGETITIADNHVRGDFPKLVGRFSAGDFGVIPATLRAGQTFVSADSQRDESLPAAEREALRRLNHIAILAVPLVKAGRWVSNLGAFHGEPREWTADEIALVEEAAERTWAAVERARAEEALRESEERLRALVENLPGGAVFVVDKNLRYLIAEGEALAAAGYAPHELIGRTVGEAMPPELAASYEPMYRQALAGESFEHEHEAHDRTFVSRGVPLADAAGEIYAVLATSYDITERRRAEEAVRESEERLRLATEAGGLGAWEWNLRTDEVFWNEQHFILFGMEPRPNPLRSQDFFDHVHPDERERVAEELKQSVAEKTVFETDFRAITEANEVRWMSGYGRVVEDVGGGEPTKMSGLMFDITDRKHAEEKLRESEERFRATFEQANVGIVQLSAGGEFLMVNPGFCNIVGYSEEECLDMTVRDITHPDDYALEEAETRRLMAGEIAGYTLEKRFTHQNGSIVWGTMTAALVLTESGEPFYLLSIVEDITERVRAEETLRESEERLRLLVESAKDYAIFTLDFGRRVTSWNPGAEAIFGYTEAEIIGRSGDILFTPEDREKEEPVKEARAALERGHASDERWHLRKDGSRFFASGVMRPLGGGETRGLAKIARDLTAQREAEETLRRSYEELEARVRERTIELQEVNEELLGEVRVRRAAEERARGLVRQIVTAQEDERKRVARDLHDQLGQQLTALQLKLETHRARVAGGDDGGLVEQVEEIQDLARQLDGEVDFLAWELRPASLDHLGLPAALENFVEEWSKHFGIRADFHTTGFVTEADRLSPEIEINLYRIAQEALNNAYKHSGASRVDVIFERRADHVVLIVEDDGKGFRPRRAVGPKDKGIGLLNMRERASFIGGTMEIESAPGEGTTLFVRVPLREVSHE